jgi:hypothetical protein
VFDVEHGGGERTAEGLPGVRLGQRAAMFRAWVVVLAAFALLAPAVAAAAAPDELSTTDRLDARRFVTAGPRAYDIGTEGGRYPAMGFHTRGEMGGIWSPPVKLLDGIWFGVDGAWIGPATRFTSGQGSVRMALPGTPGLSVERTDFVPAGRAACSSACASRRPAASRRLTSRWRPTPS